MRTGTSRCGSATALQRLEVHGCILQSQLENDEKNWISITEKINEIKDRHENYII